MLETVREFGLERLAASGEEDDARRRHAEHFLRLSADLGHGLPVLMDQDSLSRVVAEHDNVRLALAWFDEHGEIDALLQLSSMLYGLWLGQDSIARGCSGSSGRWSGPARHPPRGCARSMGGHPGDFPGGLCPRRVLLR